MILLVALIWRTPAATAATRRPRLINPPPARRSTLRMLALGVVSLMLLASGFLLYEHWRDSTEVIFIRVVDAGTGRATEYRAQRGGDIEDREFLTTDGRRVSWRKPSGSRRRRSGRVVRRAKIERDGKARLPTRVDFHLMWQVGCKQYQQTGRGFTTTCASSSCRIRRPLSSGQFT